MENKFLKKKIEENVLVASEVADLLKVSRQNVAHLVKSGQLPVLKQIPNGYLFFKGDVEEYLLNRTIRLEDDRREIHGGTTMRALEYFSDNLADKQNVDSIYIYFDRDDAALDGFYTLYESYSDNEIIDLRVPTMVIRYDDGDDVWFTGLNCGYGGTGPCGSMEVLESIGVDREIIELIPYAKWLKIYFDNGTWSYDIEERNHSVEYKLISTFSSRVCLYNMKQIILCDFYEGRMDGYDSEEAIAHALSYIKSPKSITLYSKETALNTGHYIGSTAWDAKYYQIVIADESGRELWLDYHVSERLPLKRQSKVLTVFEQAGITLEDDKMKKIPEFIKRILGANVTINDYFVATKE